MEDLSKLKRKQIKILHDKGETSFSIQDYEDTTLFIFGIRFAFFINMEWNFCKYLCYGWIRVYLLKWELYSN
ncbi:unnamed protein product [Hermetia illucens]|uniref:Uncharacterized protein n=1 Tax=Hermetia illucens TaxID=343691 RepID=A0A7R8Z163_HERIL|nr:unnamed protein product [Hermetia illucens]